jgi:hypothetical protein
VVIVSLARDDLRDEFIMADEAFALSPISARAAQPSEGDYDAISEAFMETSRGRWFLGEYAKRNRNADTRMVLDAVARIEQTLAAQKQPQPAPESGLAEALAAIRRAVDEARAAASAAIDGLALEQSLAPVRKGARVIREISWRLREIGADGRICDLIDSQVGAIEAGCGHVAASDPLSGLSAAFDLIERQIEAFDDSDAASRQDTAEDVSSAAFAPSDQPPDEIAATAEAVQAAASDAPEAATPDAAMSAEAVATATEAYGASAAAAEAAGVAAEAAEAEPAEVAAEPAEVAAEPEEVPVEVADAHDDAVLDLVALEMAAPDPSDSEEPYDGGADETPVASSSAPAEPIAQMPIAAPAIQPSLQPSLGSTLIANGIVRRPQRSESDPLAPIRRMSQAEKIALFS